MQEDVHPFTARGRRWQQWERYGATDSVNPACDIVTPVEPSHDLAATADANLESRIGCTAPSVCETGVGTKQRVMNLVLNLQNSANHVGFSSSGTLWCTTLKCAFRSVHKWLVSLRWIATRNYVAQLLRGTIVNRTYGVDKT